MNEKLTKVSEVKLIYTSNVKASERIRIKDSQSAFCVFWDYWDKEIIEHTEQVVLLLLSRSKETVGIVLISKGGTSGCIMDTKVILQYALKANAHSIIQAHNHPSGKKNTSEADLKVSKRIKSACELVDLHLLDHIIITAQGEYTSIADEGGM